MKKKARSKRLWSIVDPKGRLVNQERGFKTEGEAWLDAAVDDYGMSSTAADIRITALLAAGYRAAKVRIVEE